MMVFSMNTLAMVSAMHAVVIGVFSSLVFLALGMMIGRAQAMKRMGAADGASAKEGRREGGDELYVGNLPYEVGDKDLKKAFQKFGKVSSARVITNKGSGKSKGFGFVAMEGRAACDAAIKGLHGSELRGRKLVVNRAK